MAKEGDRSTAADKGKGKVDDVKDLPGGKKPQKDEKSAADEKKKEEEPKEGWSPAPASIGGTVLRSMLTDRLRGAQ